MPPAPTAAPPKGKAPKPKPGAGKGLTKRVGPFALWVWLALGGAVLVAVYLWHRGRGGTPAPGSPMEIVTGSRAASPYEQASAGAPTENAAPGEMMNPADLQYAYSYEELRGNIKDIEDALERSGWLFEDQQIIPPSLPFSSEAVLDATLAPPGQTPQTVAARSAGGGVKWYGRTFQTKRQLAEALSGRGYKGTKTPSAAYQRWAQLHPGAAAGLAGPVPKAKAPPKTPTKKQKPKQPTPKAQAKAKQAPRQKSTRTHYAAARKAVR